MRFNRKLLIFFIIILSAGYLPASQISYHIKPQKIEKGKVFLVTFENLDDKKKYLLKISGNKDYTHKLNIIKKYTTKLIGINLKSPDILKISLLENGKNIIADKIKLYDLEITKEITHIKINKKYVTPKKSSIKRIEEEYKKKQKAKNIKIKERYFKGEPEFPVINGKIGKLFGDQRIFNKKKKSIHYGTDISAPKRTPVKTIFKGKIVLTGNLYYTGKTVVVHHGDGLLSLYAHLNKITVKKGQMVEKGEKIGTIGSTGRSTGPHLHLSTYVNGITVDPMSIFELLKTE